ncbi:uncharacterized protein LOC111126591 isoform X2 [Crassostrea virginica]
MNTFGSFFLISCIAVSSGWHLRVSLNDIFKGNCRTVSPRVCRKSLQAFDPDYSCGFILRSVCSGTNKIERVRTRRSALMPNQEHTLHVTPLPKKMAFYDANADGQISIKEFARTLGHDPRAFHVKDAFRVADSNGDGLVDAYEFENDAWIFDDDFDDDDYDLEDTDEHSYKSANFDLLDTSDESSSSSDSSSQSSKQSGSNDSGDIDYYDTDSKDSSDSDENGMSSSDSSNSGSNSGDDDSDDSSDSNSADDDDSKDSNDDSNNDSKNSNDDSNGDSTGDDDGIGNASNDDSNGDKSKSSQSKDDNDDSKDDDSKDDNKKDGLNEIFPDDLDIDEIVPKEMELGDGIIGEAIENVLGDGMELDVPELEGPDSDTMKNVGIAMALTKFQPSQNQISSKADSHGADGHSHASHTNSDFDYSKGQSNFIAAAMNPKPTMLSNALLGIGGGGSRMRSVDSTQARERFNAIAMNNRRRVPASLWPSWIVS